MNLSTSATTVSNRVSIMVGNRENTDFNSAKTIRTGFISFMFFLVFLFLTIAYYNNGKLFSYGDFVLISNKISESAKDGLRIALYGLIVIALICLEKCSNSRKNVPHNIVLGFKIEPVRCHFGAVRLETTGLYHTKLASKRFDSEPYNSQLNGSFKWV